MKKKLLISVLCVCMLIAEHQMLRCEAAPIDRQTISQLVEYNADVLDVLLAIAAQDKVYTDKDALRLCPSIIYTLKYGDASEWTNELYAPIHFLMQQFYKYGYLPRAPHDGLKKYVTSMDAPLLAVTARLAYERSGDERFQKYMFDLIPYIVSDTSKNGFLLKINDSEWWPLEYAWNTVTPQNAWFVLNGSLHGMVCIEMLKNLTGDERLIELSKKALNAYRKRSAEFFYPDDSWCYYSLNYKDGKKIINTMSKLLIELRAFHSLYILTNEEFYEEQCSLRRKMLGTILPVYKYHDTKQRKDFAVLLRACAPHPYYVEIYPSTLELLDKNKNVVCTVKANSRDVSNSYVIKEVPNNVMFYRLYGQINPVKKTLIAEGNVREISERDIYANILNGTWSMAFGDGIMHDNILSIDSARTSKLLAGATYNIEEPLLCNRETYFIIEFNNKSDSVLSLRTNIYAEDGTAFYRYLPECRPGKNVQIISHLGCKNLTWTLKKIKSLSLIWATNKLSANDKVNICIGKVYVCKNTAQVVNYLKQYKWSDYWIISD